MEVCEDNILEQKDTSRNNLKPSDERFTGMESSDEVPPTTEHEDHSKVMDVPSSEEPVKDTDQSNLKESSKSPCDAADLAKNETKEKLSENVSPPETNQSNIRSKNTYIEGMERSHETEKAPKEKMPKYRSEKLSSPEHGIRKAYLKDTERPHVTEKAPKEKMPKYRSEKLSSPEPNPPHFKTCKTDLKVARIVDGGRVSFISTEALLHLVMRDQVVLFVFEPNLEAHEVFQIRRDENFDEGAFHYCLSQIDKQLESERRKRKKFRGTVPKQECWNSNYESNVNEPAEDSGEVLLKKIKLEPESDYPDNDFNHPATSPAVEDVAPENIQCEPSVSCLISGSPHENTDEFPTGQAPWNVSPRKQQFCPFCKQMTSTFSRHLGRVHRNVKEVQEILALPTSEKQSALKALRARGNDELEALSPGQVTKRKMPNDRCTFCGLKTTSLLYHLTKYHFEEEIVIKLRSCPPDSIERKQIMADLRFSGKCIAPVVPEEPAAAVFVACPVCKKLFNSHAISRHTKKCSVTKTSKKVKKKILVNVPDKYKELTPLLSSLKDDITTAYLLTDECILYLAQQWIDKFPIVRVGNATIKSNIRNLAKLVLDANKLSSQVSELRDLFQVRHFDLFKSCILSADHNGDSNDQNSTPTMPRHLGVLMLHCYKHLRIKFLEEKESTMVKELDDWYYLYRSEFKSTPTKAAKKSFSDSIYENSMNDSLNTSAGSKLGPDASPLNKSHETSSVSSYFQDGSQKVSSSFSKWTPKPKVTFTMNLKKPQLLSLTEDIKKLNEFLISEIKKCVQSLDASFNFNDWVTLTEVALIRFMMYNHKKVRHCEIFLRTDLEQRQKIEMDSDLYLLLSILEKVISERVMLVKLTPPGANESYLLLDDVMASGMEVIVKNRLHAGVDKDNPCTFGEGEVDYFSVKECLNNLVHKANLTNPEILMKVAVQNYIAAVSKTIDLTEDDLTKLRSHLGHTSEKYDDFYKVPTEIEHLAQISLLVLEMDEAGNEGIQKVADSDILADSDEVELSGEGDSEDIGERAEGNELPYNPFHVSTSISTPGSRRAHGKKKWSASEKRRMRQLFSEYIDKNELPSLPCCEMIRNRYIELRNRTPEQIKACVYNETVRVKRNQKTEWFQ